MTVRAIARPPLQIDRVERARGESGSVELRLGGHWLDPAAAAEEELLVVQVEGRRHRFPGARAQTGGCRDGDEHGSRPSAARDRWEATFTIPDWAEPRHDGQAALWLGSAVVPVPPPGGTAAPLAAGEAAAPVAAGEAAAPLAAGEAAAPVA